MMIMKVKIYQARDGWRWRLLAGNNRLVAESGEAYTRKHDCLKAWARARRGAENARIGY